MHSDRMLKAQRIRVIREEGKTGLYYATSPDLRGLLVAEPSLDALEREIPNAIRDLYKASGENVVVTQMQDEGEMPPVQSWVVLPMQLISREQLSDATA